MAYPRAPIFKLDRIRNVVSAYDFQTKAVQLYILSMLLVQ